MTGQLPPHQRALNNPLTPLNLTTSQPPHPHNPVTTPLEPHRGTPTGQPFPLDIRMELDDTSAFRNGPKWGDVEFPLPFGRTLTAAEQYVVSLDEATGERVT